MLEHPRARNSDPVGSLEAADAIERNGTAKIQMQHALNAVRQHPGESSLSLAGKTGLCRFMLARRLPELLKQHQVDRIEGGKCPSTGRTAALWYDKDFRHE